MEDGVDLQLGHPAQAFGGFGGRAAAARPGDTARGSCSCRLGTAAATHSVGVLALRSRALLVCARAHSSDQCRLTCPRLMSKHRRVVYVSISCRRPAAGSCGVAALPACPPLIMHCHASLKHLQVSGRYNRRAECMLVSAEPNAHIDCHA